MKFASNFDLSPLKKKYEATEGASKTLPQDSFSIKEILKRYARGHDISGLTRHAKYDKEGISMDDIPLSKGPTDLTDLDAAKASIEAVKSKALKEELENKAAVAAAKKAAEAAAVDGGPGEDPGSAT